MSSLSMVVGVVIGPASILAAVAVGLPNQGDSDVTLRLDTGKASYVVFEPLELTYVVENRTDEEVRSLVDIDPSQLHLVVTREEGSPAELQAGPYTKCTVDTSERVLRAREFMVESVTINFGANGQGALFLTPGHYRIRGELAAGTPERRSIVSDEIDVDVTEPGAEDDLLIKELGSSAALVELLHQGSIQVCAMRPLGECVASLLDVARRYRGSAYSPAIFMDIAAAAVVDENRGEVAASGARAPTLLEEFVKTWPNHSRRWRAEEALCGSIARTGNREAAVACIDRVKKRFPHREPMVNLDAKPMKTGIQRQ